MDQLFKALPRDLQWEVLSEFVGTHKVRNGKLIRKIVYGMVNGILVRHMEDSTYSAVVNGLRVRQRLAWLRDRTEDALPRYIRFATLRPRQIMFCEDGSNGGTIFGYRKIVDSHILWEIQYPESIVEEVVVLPLFVKHSYPSYPDTDKKKKRLNFR